MVAPYVPVDNEEPTPGTGYIPPFPISQETFPMAEQTIPHATPVPHEPAHTAEHEVLLDLARQMRQATRTDNQVERTVTFTEAEANAMADALEQLAPRFHAMRANTQPHATAPVSKPEDKK